MRFLLYTISILSLLISACISSSEKINSGTEPLFGSWRLLADQEVDSTGMVIRQDTSVSGLLIYTPAGKMSVQLLWHGSRSKIMTDTIMKKDGMSLGIGLGSNKWTMEEARTILDTYDAYFGNYSIDPVHHEVSHIITGNLRPEKTGTIFKRNFQLIGDTLLLRSIDAKLKWQVAWVRI